MLTMRDTSAPLPHAATAVGQGEPDTRSLAGLISAHAPYDGSFELRVPGVHAVRLSRTNAEPVPVMPRPGVCIVAQGTKTVLLGPQVLEYDAARLIVYSIDVPLTAQVTRASRAEPFLCLKVELDPHKLAELVLRVYPHGLPQAQQKRAVYIGQSDAAIVNAATRLVELMADAGDAALLAPLVIDEILIRLLRSPIGGRVAQIGQADSSVRRVAQAVEWLRANFAEPMNVEALADLVNMSVSSFHQHFKAVTSMSPLQFQKALRLQEARRLMIATMADTATASRRVGYLSASQFTREYGRYFGTAPTRDIARLREQGGTGVGIAE